MPPSSCGSDAFSARTACDASLTIAAYALQSGSSSRSQCDLLFGSFQNLTASIMWRASGGLGGGEPGTTARLELVAADESFHQFVSFLIAELQRRRLHEVR